MGVLGFKYALGRAFNRFVVQPHRQKKWADKRVPFEFTGAEGLRFALYPGEYVDSQIYQHGLYERRFLELLRSTLPSGLTALDIGANIGNHSVYLGQFFSEVHAFEPNPTVLPRLKRNITLNGLDRQITVHPVGLGKEANIVSFRDNADGNLGGSKFLKPGESASEDDCVRELRIENGDEYVSKLQLPYLHFIKVDVEGWEADVLEGLKETIAKYRPAIAFEFHGQWAEEGEFNRIRTCLPDYVFGEPRWAADNASIIDKLTWNYRRRGRPEIELFETPEKRTYENVLALPDKHRLTMFLGPEPL